MSNKTEDSRPLRNAHYFIDADNVPNHQVPETAIRALRDLTCTSPDTAIIAGISETRIQSWSKALLSANPALVPEKLLVHPKENAADVALVLAMGRRMGQISEGDLIFVLSADKWILQAAEQLSERGLAVHAVVFGNVLSNTDLGIHKIQLSLPKTPPEAAKTPQLPPVEPTVHDSKAQQVLLGFFQKYPTKFGKPVKKTELGGYMQAVMAIGKSERTRLYGLLGMSKCAERSFQSADIGESLGNGTIRS